MPPASSEVSSAAGNARPAGIYWLLWSCFSSKAFMVLLRAAWVVSNNFYCIPAYFMMLALSTPLLVIRAELFWFLEETFFDWLLSMVACWSHTAGYSIVESGDHLEDYVTDTFLFMPNHQSTADVPLCMTLFVARRNFAQKVMWIMDKVFKYTNFGWVSWMHHDFFILAGKSNRERSLIELRAHLKEVFIPKNRQYLVLFPEGGFLHNRKPVSQRFAEEQGLRHLEHVTLPRTGALEVVLDELAPNLIKRQRSQLSNGSCMAGTEDGASASSSLQTDRLTKLVDVTIAYPEGKPLDLLAIALATRPPCTIHVHYRVFDIEDVPLETEAMKQWMYQLYYEKEEMLNKYYETGVFPHQMFSGDRKTALNGGARQRTSRTEPRKLMHDSLRFLFLHLFFVISSFVMWHFVMALRTSIANVLF